MRSDRHLRRWSLLTEALKRAECIVTPADGRVAGASHGERALVVVAVVIAARCISLMSISSRKGLQIDIALPTRIGTDAGNVVLEGGREVRADPGVEAVVGAETTPVSIRADVDVAVYISSAGLKYS